MACRAFSFSKGSLRKEGSRESAWGSMSSPETEGGKSLTDMYVLLKRRSWSIKSARNTHCILS